MLMPTVANGITLDWNIARARGENFEFEYHPTFLPRRASVACGRWRFVNHANMGSYRGSNQRLSVGQVMRCRTSRNTASKDE